MQRADEFRASIDYGAAADYLRVALTRQPWNAALHVKLKYLDEWNAARRRNAQAYSRLLTTTQVGIPCEAEYAEAVWNSYVVRSNERQTLQEHLARNGVATTIQYPIPAHLQPAFRHLGYAQGDFPVTERLAQYPMVMQYRLR